MAEKKKIISNFYNWTFLAVVVAGLILVNVISSFVYHRVDMTKDQRYSLSQGTEKFLSNKANFKGRINLKIYLAGNLPADLEHFRQAIEDKLIEFRQFAGDRIEYQFIDPKVGTKQEQQELEQNLWAEGKGILPMNIVYTKDGAQNQMLLWPGAVIEYGGSTVQTVQFLPGSKTNTPFQLKGMTDLIQNSINNLEYMLVSSLRRATQEKKPTIAFLQGHGELSFAETQRARALISPYFTIKDVTLNDSIHALDNVEGMIIARPRSKFSQKDLYLIDQFVMKGGRLMCFMDKLQLPEDSLNKYGQTHTTRYETGLDNMLFDYGLSLNDNLIMDARCALRPLPIEQTPVIPWFFHVLATPTSHAMSRNVEPISLKYTSEVQFTRSEDPDVVLTPVLTSSTNSIPTGKAPMVNLLLPLNYGESPKLVPNPKNEANKKCVAGLAEGQFKSYFKNRIVDEFINNPEIDYKETTQQEGKILLIGNGRWIANRYDSMPNPSGTSMMYRPIDFNDLQFDEAMYNMQIPHIFGNQEFFQNMVDYMMGDNSVLDIRSRQIDIHEIDNEKVKEEATFYKILNVGVPVLLILIFAFAMNFVRKRKFAR